MPLIVVPTPIGNLEDMTLRGLRALREADLIICEDTRRTIKLLNHYEIRKPMLSYHQHNEQSRTAQIVEKLRGGQTVALVSDAGTPGISDPGYILIKEAIGAGIPLDVLPGANAALPAILLSGLCLQPFTFVGFLEGKEKAKTEKLREFAQLPTTLIFYIAPHGLPRELDFFAGSLGNRHAALVREISKVHQETLRGTLDEIAAISRERELKGEMVLVVEGAAENTEKIPADWKEKALEMRNLGIFDKEIANELFASYGIPRNSVKNFLLQEVPRDGRKR